MSTPNKDASERAARLTEVRERQRRAERRRTALITGVSALVGAVLIAVTAIVIVGEQRRQADVAEAAAGDIPGVLTFTDLSATHVQQPVQYEQTPPVGGDHAGVWANCGTYTEPIPSEVAVHSLEHGAVWITYSPDLPAEQVQELTDLAEGNAYLLLSPFDGLPEEPVVASAWGTQLSLETADDPRLEQFLVKYQQGEQTPEPGAPCTGGVDA
ncbi:DUF3105 domain-containing protein [Cellulomonas sp. ATA003]|uniref:DUF3105 domain-containing protein n=1 Tax=Cellulomonas sp. ATA003 TaxID=3073064 RepID=UPI00287338C8|nr:DUF3105 domain-containing protein [Cellulomonas sp. ATA003]WNB84743.1 DUF3105 domain-containing protein [Cellulomonas sp. ATA003]